MSIPVWVKEETILKEVPMACKSDDNQRMVLSQEDAGTNDMNISLVCTTMRVWYDFFTAGFSAHIPRGLSAGP